MAKIFTNQDKVEMNAFVELISEAEYKLKGHQIHGASRSFYWLQDLSARIHKHAEVELFKREEFEVQITKMPDPEPAAESAKKKKG